jgi:hypothetical protein
MLHLTYQNASSRSGDERSSIRSFVTALYGSWQPNRLLALMTIVDLKAFIDESGTHEPSLTVMAGWLGYAGEWANFESKWNSLVTSRGLEYIHAIDLKHGRKAFKDKDKWPFPRRLALANELERLTEAHTICSLSVLLKGTDYNSEYLGGDKCLSRRRSKTDSRYGVCARVYLSMLSLLAERYGGKDAQVTVIFEDGSKNRGAPQEILKEMYDIAPDRARFINPIIGYALKNKSPGVQTADCLAYPVYVHERPIATEVRGFRNGFDIASVPLSLDGLIHLRAPISSQTLHDIREGQIAMSRLKRRFGRHWSQLQGLPVGWTVTPLQSIDGFVVVPNRSSQSPQQTDGSHRELDEPIGSVRLKCF